MMTMISRSNARTGEPRSFRHLHLNLSDALDCNPHHSLFPIQVVRPCTLHAAHRLALTEHLLSCLRSSVDLLKSTQPKWVPCYRERDFADERGSHATRCSLARA